jgi:hypothetical protein
LSLTALRGVDTLQITCVILPAEWFSEAL